MSQYTGRIHLYSCIPGIDSRPRPLFENFRPEEVDPLNPNGANHSKKTTVVAVKDNPAYRDALLAFVKEWNNLRPIQQKKLLQKPLQLPLTVELCYLSEGINHTSHVCMHELNTLCFFALCFFLFSFPFTCRRYLLLV